MVRMQIENCNDQYTQLKAQMEQNDVDDKHNATAEKLPPFDDYPEQLPLAVQIPLMPN